MFVVGMNQMTCGGQKKPNRAKQKIMMRHA